MTCFRHGAAILCTRGRRSRPELPSCRYPGCDRRATQAGWGCRPHWFKLPPDLRSRILRAASVEVDVNHRLGLAWSAAAEEGDRWVAEQLAKPSTPNWRQPELPL